MPYPDKGLPNFPGGGGTHTDDSGLNQDELKAALFNEAERVGEIGFNGLEGDAIISGATVNLVTSTGPSLIITGSGGPITDFGTAPRAGWRRFLQFSGAPTIQHGAAAINCPGGVDLVISAGDTLEVISLDAAGAWLIYNYQPAIYRGGLVQPEVVSEDRTWTTIALPYPTWPDQLSLPQVSKTALLIAGVTITPRYADSKLIIEGQAIGAFSGGNRNLAIAIFKDAETNAREFSTPELATTAGWIQQTWVKYIMDPAGSTSAMTFYLRGMSTVTATTNFERNGSSGQFRWGGAMSNRISVREERP